MLSSLHRIGGKNPTLVVDTTTDRRVGSGIKRLPKIGVQAVGSTQGLPRPGSPIKLAVVGNITSWLNASIRKSYQMQMNLKTRPF